MHDYEAEFVDITSVEPLPVEWVLPGLLPVGLHFVGGPPKSLKSALTVALCCRAAGMPCRADQLGGQPQPDPMRVLYFSAEAGAVELADTATGRLGGWAEPRHGALMVASNPWQFRLDSDEGRAKMVTWLNEIEPRMVVIDPLRDFHGLAEKDDGAMNRLLRPLQRWARLVQGAVLVVHHTAKPREGRTPGPMGPEDLRGSGALWAIADGAIMLTPIRLGQSARVMAKFKRAGGWEMRWNI